MIVEACLLDASAWRKAGALVLLSFFSEDAATWSGAGLAVTRLLPGWTAFTACFCGIWVGDLAIYGVARFFGRHFLDLAWVRRWIARERLAEGEAWLQRRGALVLLTCRFTPGLRVPVYVMAGLLRLPALLFAGVTALAAFLWVGVIFLLVIFLGEGVLSYLKMAHHALLMLALALTGALLLIVLSFSWKKRPPAFLSWPGWRRWQQWEFWPAPVFYFPVALYYLWLGLKYRSFTLPLVANPGIYTGGMIGESKFATLRDLLQSSPEFTAATLLITGLTGAEKLRSFAEQKARSGLAYPLVLKPDIGQRGSGFKRIRSEAEAERYLHQVEGEVLLQEYLPGPHELGVFYYRFPDQPCGRIFALTEKVFPVLVGDGLRTIAELIQRDPRARLMAPVYLQRLGERSTQILPVGENLKLVEAGNHAQGCIFRDGWDAYTEPLAARIDTISRGLPGFFIGRYDIRYASPEALRNGEGFKILELNGASAEATNIYDERNSLVTAYRTLFRQWDLVFAIGAANRARGHRPVSLVILGREWRAYQKRSASHPLAD